MEETKRLMGDLHADNILLRGELGKVRKSMNRRDKLGGVVLVVVLLIGFVLYRDRQFRGCMTDWATQYTARTLSLSGPASDRIDYFLQAYTEAAGAKHKPLTSIGRTKLIAMLDRDRREFTAMPKHDVLVKSTEAQLLAYRDLLRSLRANTDYKSRAASHPVPTAPTCGGLL